MFVTSRPLYHFTGLIGLFCLTFLFVTESPAQRLRFDNMIFLIETQNGDTADVYINGRRVGETPYLLTLMDLEARRFCSISTPVPKSIDLDADASFTAYSNSGMEVQTFVRNARPDDNSFAETFTFRMIDGDDQSNCTLMVSVIDRRGNYIPCLRGKLHSEGEDLVQKWFFGMI